MVCHKLCKYSRIADVGATTRTDKAVFCLRQNKSKVRSNVCAPALTTGTKTMGRYLISFFLIFGLNSSVMSLRFIDFVITDATLFITLSVSKIFVSPTHDGKWCL